MDKFGKLQWTKYKQECGEYEYGDVYKMFIFSNY